jgi:hypothetical protein
MGVSCSIILYDDARAESNWIQVHDTAVIWIVVSEFESIRSASGTDVVACVAGEGSYSNPKDEEEYIDSKL